MSGIINIATTAARAAEKIIIQGFTRLDRVRVSEKEENNYVSDIDHKAEAAIVDTIKKAYPSHSIIAEESGIHEGDQNTWIIDPLDGTRNFIHGLPHFAVSIGFKYQDQLEHAVIYAPFNNELFTASKGSGAQMNNRRIRVSTTTRMRQSLIGTAFPKANAEQLSNYMMEYMKLYKSCSGLRHSGSIALDLAYIAAGRLDGLWAYNAKIWDIAAGSLLITEAGGTVTDMSGNNTNLDSGDLIAGNIKIHQQIGKKLDKFI